MYAHGSDRENRIDKYVIDLFLVRNMIGCVHGMHSKSGLGRGWSDHLLVMQVDSNLRMPVLWIF